MKLTPELLLSAYQQGYFPMAEADGEIFWYQPEPRTVIPLDDFHCPKSLARVVRSNRFEVRIDTSFERVIRRCAEPRSAEEGVWLNEEIIQVFIELHHTGIAHSVETWKDEALVGGLYGLSIRGLFAGESMFSRATDASKFALVHLVEHMKACGMVLLDTQFTTEHLQRFGAVEIPAEEYERRLKEALALDVSFG